MILISHSKRSEKLIALAMTMGNDIGRFHVTIRIVTQFAITNMAIDEDIWGRLIATICRNRCAGLNALTYFDQSLESGQLSLGLRSELFFEPLLPIAE